jgi:hypothetical protein
MQKIEVMKEDKLEQFIKNHAEDFNSLEPPSMAWNSIEKELPVQKLTPIRILWPYAWKVAAAIIIFASAWMLKDYTDHSTPSEKPVISAEANPQLNELSDAEAYYTSQISNKQAELAHYARQHPEIIEDLKKEFTEMDKGKTELKNDLAESNADEKVIEAIILSYRVKLEILDQILNELRRSKDGNQKLIETKL